MSEILGYAVLNISCDKIQLFVANIDCNGNNLNVLSYYEDHHTAIKDCNLIDAEQLIRKINTLINKTNFFLNIKIRDIILVFPNTAVQIQEGKLSFNLGKEGKEIVYSDIENMFLAAGKQSAQKERYLINIFPRYFSVNNVKNIENPIGLIGQRIDFNYFSISSEKQFFSNILNIIEQVNLKVIDIFPKFYCNFYEIYNRIKQENISIIDISNNTTTVSIFNSGSIFKYKLFKYGINDIYSKLAEKYNIVYDNIHEILENCIFIDDTKAEDIVVYRLDLNSSIIDITEQDLAQVISGTIKAIAEHCKDFIDFFEQYTDQPLFIVGDISNLPGYRSLMEKVFKKYNLKFIDNNVVGLREYSTLHLTGAIKLLTQRIKVLHNKFKPIKIETNIKYNDNIKSGEIFSRNNNTFTENKSLWEKITSYFFD